MSKNIVGRTGILSRHDCTIFAKSRSGTWKVEWSRSDRCFAAVSLSLIGYAATKPRIKLFRSEHLVSPRICIDDLFSCAKREWVSRALQFMAALKAEHFGT